MRVVVTRAVHQAEELAEPLRQRGAEVLLVPVIGIAPPVDTARLREAAAECEKYDWLIFTSTNAVTAFAAELPSTGFAGTARVAAVGSATAAAAVRCGFSVSVVPAEYVAESLVEALGAEELRGKSVLIPGAAMRRDLVPRALREQSASVDVVEAYRNVVPPEAAYRAEAVFCDPWPDWITFASSSAVANAVGLAGSATIARMKIATIGPVTSATVRKHGLRVSAEADPHTMAALVDALFAA